MKCLSFKILSQHSSWGDEEKQEKLQCMVAYPTAEIKTWLFLRMEPRTKKNYNMPSSQFHKFSIAKIMKKIEHWSV